MTKKKKKRKKVRHVRAKRKSARRGSRAAPRSSVVVRQARKNRIPRKVQPLRRRSRAKQRTVLRKKKRSKSARSSAQVPRKSRVRRKTRKTRVSKKVSKKTTIRHDRVVATPKLQKFPPLVGPIVHAFPGRGIPASLKLTEEERDKELLRRAKEAYEAGSLDQDYLDIALDLGVSDHDAYSAAFGYLPMTAGVAA